MDIKGKKRGYLTWVLKAVVVSREKELVRKGILSTRNSINKVQEA